MEEKAWYLAVLVVECTIPEVSDHEPLVDLQHCLIRASNSEEAWQAAMKLGQSRECDYKNMNEEAVLWKFAGLHDLCSIETKRLRHGVEVYSELWPQPASKLVYPKSELREFATEEIAHLPAEEVLERIEGQGRKRNR